MLQVMQVARTHGFGQWENRRVCRRHLGSLNVSLLCDYGLNMANYDFLVERVRWFREQAAVDRLKEELELLEEEFRRTHKTHLQMSEVWGRLATHTDNTGYACYARRQAHMYGLLAGDCHSIWIETTKVQKTSTSSA